MDWLTPEFHHNALVAVFSFNIFMFIVLLFMNAPYGRQDTDDVNPLWGPRIPLKLGWFILEFPVFFMFGLFYLLGDNWAKPAPVILFLLWEVHYFHRTFIYPRTLKAKPGAGFRLGILSAGIPLNAANGFINGWYISEYGEHLYNISWLYDPRFILGVALFFAGFTLAKQSDKILADLRKPGETGYKIPFGGAFRWVSCPNYLGEVLQWCGFAVACWSIPALAFAFLTLSNLLPRALSNHRWYLEKFPDYPKSRKSLVPYII